MNFTTVFGVDTLISALDREVLPTAPRSVDRLRHQVSRMVSRGALQLPGRVPQVEGESYARRELYCSPTLGYTIVAIVWGPGQAAPLHDHNGKWGVEVVLRGVIEVTEFSLVDFNADRYAFTTEMSYELGFGATACVSPPHEHHTVKNPHAEPAVSLHVYGGCVRECNTFELDGDGWYRRRTRHLASMPPGDFRPR